MNKIYDNGAVMLGEIKKIREYTEKQYDDNLIDEELKVDILNDLKDYKDNEIVVINYDGIGYSIDCWSPEDIIEECE